MVDIERLEAEHWPDVQRIHREGIDTGEATFEMEPPADWETFSEAHLRFGRLVAVSGNRVLGWAALTPVSDRCVYAGVAEVSIYVGGAERGRGVGAHLMRALIAEAETNGIWTLQAGIFPENEGSLSLHDRFGFRVVGRRERLGKLRGRWRDVLLLERRSLEVGID